jgi:hypothetical protein
MSQKSGLWVKLRAFSRYYVGADAVLTTETEKDHTPRIFPGSHINRFFPLLVAVGAKPMFWSGVVYLWIERVNENSRSKVFKKILSCLSIPVLYLNQAIFKFRFLIQQGLILSLLSKHCGLHGDYSRLGFDGLFSDSGSHLGLEDKSSEVTERFHSR